MLFYISKSVLFVEKLINKLSRIFGGPVLAQLEALLYRKPKDLLAHPPIFFLGAPRSGTTLAMQVITDVFDVGYLSNFHGKYFGAPALAEMVFHPIHDRPRSSYHSVHGRTDRPYDPSECGQWWYRFFRRQPRYVDLGGVSNRNMECFRGSVASLIRAFGKPVLFKNPHAALRIQPITKYIPESLFIIMVRDELDNAHSLLEVRKRVYDDYEKWWSMEPPAVTELEKLPAHQQVVEQIRHIYSTIDKDLAISGVDPKCCFRLSYEELCVNPEKEMNRLDEFFQANRCKVARRFAPPEPFRRREKVRIDPELFESLKNYVRKS